MTGTAGVPVDSCGSPPDRSDTELWRAAAGGDHGAFTELFERHAQSVWNHAYRLTGSWASAEDLTSTTFLTAWRRKADITLVRDSALPWLYAVAGNFARTEHRSTGRRLRLVRRLPEPRTVSDHADTVVDQLDGEDRLRQVLALVAKLPKSQRQAVELCLLGDLSLPDAAELLGVAEVTVRAHISRARAQLRAALEEK
ncbi:RNA polymerase sigma factor [Amycolatopsis sp. BJA-103]|uniref:RNA polymerase sigma factor n=1 Tax=Amycolatopsis sp. BJA-103 TaxID=1911175 RepID=UPI000C78FBED|nr:RNA polymerase sigma factor [Amycolatopsis sp. BJA-103]AUI63477.1 RNA polymerase subunit sigma-70 [Amycolatopsis sp. BJA-103]PNE19324.1 RNA polymerase subunit sigma-70 [Amycolatopsis sp. BJA-103]